MRILFLGDVVGRSGRDAVSALLPALKLELRADLVIINGENASHGFGLGPDMAEAMFAAGADAVTLGNHSWDRRELIPYIAQERRVIRPLNFPPGTPGAGFIDIVLADGRRALVINAMGRLYMDALDDPFRATAELLSRYKLGASVQAIVADFHAEATSEKLAYGHSFDGTMSLVVGTHTHVPTSDHQILPGGTAYQSDAGMCGDYDSVIGMSKQGGCGAVLDQDARRTDATGRWRGHVMRRVCRNRRQDRVGNRGRAGAARWAAVPGDASPVEQATPVL